jgi:phage terminase large subunit
LSSDQIQDFIDAYEKSETDQWWYWWWKVYGEGEDAVLLEERIMPFIKKVAKVPSGAVEIPSALDFGWFPDPTSFCRLFVKKNPNSLKDDLYIQQIIYGTKLSINSKSEGATNLVEKLVEMKINKLHQIIAESADPRAVEDMRQAGFNIEKVKKTSVETSIRSFHDYNIHFVGDSDESYEEFDQYKYKRDKQTNEILSVPDDHQSDHSIAGTRYVLQHRGTRWSV